jgi:D-amino-acid oxidase
MDRLSYKSPMPLHVAIVGAGVSGLTCGVAFAERGVQTAIFAEQTGHETTSGAAGAIWFPYDCEPREKVIEWALETYSVLADLAGQAETGVSMIELRQYCRSGTLPLPDWALSLGASPLALLSETPGTRQFGAGEFSSGFALKVALTDTTLYLDYLERRFRAAGGSINPGVRFNNLEEVDPAHHIVVNCAGFGARELFGDADLEPHRGQVAIVPRIVDLSCAVVCDDPPLMYAIPRRDDCLFGGTNELSDDASVDPKTTARIVAECSRTLRIDPPEVLRERVGIRPFRRSGVRLERATLNDGRAVIHNYGHGGAGFTLSWGCADEVVRLAEMPA